MSFLPEGPSLTVAGRKFTDLANLKILHAVVFTAARWSTFVDGVGAGTPYQVPTGKILRISALKLHGILVEGASNILYGDTSIGHDSTVAPTNPVYFMGVPVGTRIFTVTGVDTSEEYSFDLIVPADKYPAAHFIAGGSGNMVIYGFEEDA